jgi:hypothetical protein
MPEASMASMTSPEQGAQQECSSTLSCPFFDQPARQRRHAAAAGHHLQHDVGGLDRLVALGRAVGRQQELV